LRLAHAQLGIRLLVIVASRVSLTTPTPLEVAVHVRDRSIRTITGQGRVNSRQSDEVWNGPSRALKLSFGLELVLPSLVLPHGFEAGKPDIAGSKKSTGRRDDQGNQLTKLHYRHEHHHKEMVRAPGVSRGSARPRAAIYPSAHHRTKDTCILSHQP
jgi:hypothetical protein